MKTKSIMMSASTRKGNFQGAFLLMRGALHALCFPKAELDFIVDGRFWFTVEGATMQDCGRLAVAAARLVIKGKAEIQVIDWGRGEPR